MNEPARARKNDPRLQAALEDYFDRVDRNEPVDQETFIAQHGEIAAELRLFIATEDEMRKFAAESLRDASEVPTGSFSRQPSETLPPRPVASAGASSGKSGSEDLSGQFGRYQIVRALGNGAMGTVYLAEDTQLRRQVALKTPQFTGDSQQELLERFYREARAAATLRHPCICPVYDVGDIEGRHYITMAYIEGKPLSAFVGPAVPQTEEQILIAVGKIAQALQEAHDHGIVHRDLKPANIMIDRRGEPVIMDFGLARQAQEVEDVRLTQTGVILGSPAYMSPEQVEADPAKIGPTADQYSLGVILYELLTGQIPFQGSLASLIGQILSKQPTPPGKLRPGLDPRIDAVCLKMLAKNPGDRFASLSAVASELAAIVRSRGAAAKGPVKRTGIRAAIGAAGLVILLAAVILFLRSGKAVVRIEINDADLKVALQNSTITFTGPKNDEIKVDPGETELTITHGDLKFKTDSFRLEKDKKEVLKISLVGSTVEATLDGRTLPLFPLQPGAKPNDAAVAKTDSQKSPAGPAHEALAAGPSEKAVVPTRDLLRLTFPFGALLAQQAQSSWADRLKVPVGATDSIGIKLVLIPPGEYRMGNYEGHRVRITRPCYFGAYEVTRGQFAKFVAATHYRTLAEVMPGAIKLADDKTGAKWFTTGKATWRDPGFPQEDDHPVVEIAWSDAVSFCLWLGKKEGKTYRLPTEAEWEYACRAGTMGAFYNGGQMEEVTQIGNVADATATKLFPHWMPAVKSSDGYVYTSPVGRFRPNEFGLYDMLGNAFEWCSDWYGADYFEHSPLDDPQGPESGDAHIWRGSSFTRVGGARYRFYGKETFRRPDSGFRVVREIDVPTSDAASASSAVKPSNASSKQP